MDLQIKLSDHIHNSGVKKAQKLCFDGFFVNFR